MSFVEREVEKISAVLRRTPNGDNAEVLRAVQQALLWALEPDGVMSPTGYLKKFYNLGDSATDGTGIVMGNLEPQNSDSHISG